MTELEELQGQIEELKKTINDLKTGTVRVETNVAKLDRLKGEIISEVIPDEVVKNPGRLRHFKSCVNPVVNELFFVRTNYPDESYKKTANLIFGKEDEAERLEAYLSIYRSVCEFMAQKFNGFWGKEMKFIAGDVEHTSIL